ncbi:threonine synthase [Tenacibaculum finnmarkense]|uniref:Threonine synthase n=1 Tax=Tenacibaculum finnmarkense genomovar finnmarkense TaxID=1458503 RepID=A0AAP1RHS5_9FLAO|nr:threonine synthase [Tenacibaculum finnmarkense]MBE7653829.1 threonine synthase [Tenacibaculum finnmarkense genomovar finnmarkense]MBE7661179.1 threonine synthase [Tenacibaculum finnmarkense genomovar finnmarkense]MBE7696123.1 threonine synthase [Tenacibaculum finnmarkense genomovar finnmarkense]MCD8428357.1 threonine synthase [Tenacibaculum finnmarkense genomovar finnmarkense]MCD8447195.1 threonine synthase [Tenacibaculum finnmarkense genomovar finnmarkense]
MNYYSLNKKSENVSFKEAVVNGLAPDRGLYFPENITPLSKDFITNIENYSNHEIAFEVIKQFVGDEIPSDVLQQIIKETLCFDFPVVSVEENVATLELFHGPTMAFKDVGARFMARCLGYFNRNNNDQLTVLVATSGDTGGAVADGFLGVKGVDVVILYPSGKVSDVQEKQLTTLGKNITALEVDGVFDDCQDMVKTAFLDTEIKRTLTSANSINVARWLPQMFYFFLAYKQIKQTFKQEKNQKNALENLVFSVPSGNFGNICAGMMAQKLGLPIKHFVASTNINDTVPNYLKDGIYTPKPSKATISNAMDVGNPSNFIRIQEIFENNIEALKNSFSSYSFSDEKTREAMKLIYKNSGYIADPHGAVGYLGAKEYQKNNPEAFCIFLETAHPVKFLEVVESTLNVKIAIPEQIKSVMDKEKTAIKMSTYNDLKNFLNS